MEIPLKSGNPITFIVTGTGSETQRRRAYSFDENSIKAAKLVIEYKSNSTVDLALVSCTAPTDYNSPDAAAMSMVPIMVSIGIGEWLRKI